MPVSTRLLTLLVAFSTGAAVAQVTVVASGLNQPRGLSFGPNGDLFVAEAGLGAGNGAGGIGIGVGPTSSIGVIHDVSSAHPTFSRLVTGLSSSATNEGTVGADGVSAHGMGNLKVIIAESTLSLTDDNPNASPEVLSQFGHLLRVSQGGKWKSVADVGDFDYTWTGENASQPWAPAGQFPDANPYAVVSLPGHDYVSDAAANTINEVDDNGNIRIVAYVPNPLLPFGPGGMLVPVSDAVPTCVAQGSDGMLYVGTLAFGANFATGTAQSKIYRFDPKSTEFFLDEDDVWASGFHPITGCGFANGAFYVTEFFTSGFGTPGHVVRVAINSNGSAGARTVLGGSSLHAPNGFAAGPDGSIYVSNFSVFPGRNAHGPVGQVVRVAP